MEEVGNGVRKWVGKGRYARLPAMDISYSSVDPFRVYKALWPGSARLRADVSSS